jgi:hypothetical protein
MNYYEILHDFPETGRWYLGDVFDNSANQLEISVLAGHEPFLLGSPPRLPLVGSGKLIAISSPVRVMVFKPGPPLDFTLMTVQVPVVSSAVAELLSTVAGADIQRLPVVIDRRKEAYEIINVVGRADALDIERSQIEWPPVYRRQVEGRRKPFAIYHLAVDPSRAEGHHLFRLSEWIALIASQTVKDLFEQHGVSGIRFRKV